MAEREQPDIAEQQVEGAGEQGEAQRLHQEDRIDRERCRDAERDQQEDQHPGRAVGVPSRAPRRRCDPHHAVLPNSPAGRISSTIAMMTKITVLDASA